MVHMVARLCMVVSCFLVAFGGCSGGSQSASSPDASAATGGVGGGGGQLTTATSIVPGVCVPGASVACACVTGQQGAQVCTAEGTFAPCVCAAPTVDAGGFGGSDGAATSPLDAVPTSQPDVSTTTGGRGGSAVASGGGGADGTNESGGSSGIAGSGGTAGTGGGGGGPVVDAAADQSADVSAVLDAFPDVAVDAEKAEDTSGTTTAIVSFTASPATISAGKSSTLGWTVTGATMLFIDQGVGSVLVTVLGTTSLAVTPTRTTTYTLTLNGVISAHVTVTVVPLPSITSFVTSQTVVSNAGSATLTAVFSGGTGTVDQGIGTVTSGIGTSTGPISATTTYTLTVTNAVGDSRTAQVTLTTPLMGSCVQVFQANGYSFTSTSGVVACSGCFAGEASKEPQCKAMIDCLQPSWPSCAQGSGCWLNCRNTTGSDLTVENCVANLTSKACAGH